MVDKHHNAISELHNQLRLYLDEPNPVGPEHVCGNSAAFEEACMVCQNGLQIASVRKTMQQQKAAEQSELRFVFSLSRAFAFLSTMCVLLALASDSV